MFLFYFHFSYMIYVLAIKELQNVAVKKSWNINGEKNACYKNAADHIIATFVECKHAKHILLRKYAILALHLLSIFYLHNCSTCEIFTTTIL